jgi:glycosyltransferase involved in cell wall biosynthesis
MKKKIVFIEPKLTIYTYRIARTLKLSGNYETVLFCFSDMDKSFLNNAFDEINILEWSHKPNLKNFIDFFRNVFGKKGRLFFDKLKKMKPYLFQITGSDLFTMIAILNIKKSPKIYFAYDIWATDKRNFLFTKSPGIKGCFQKSFEKICFKKADGILHKGQPEELKSLKLKIPDLAFIPGCLDEWIYPPKRKNIGKDIQLVYASEPWLSHDGAIPFPNVIGKIISQKINFHVFGNFINSKEKELFSSQVKDKNYFHIHKKEKADKLNENLSKYDYGTIFSFYDNSVSPSVLEGQMPNKLFNYIEAGIPIIVSDQLKFIADIIEENKIGFRINHSDLDNLKKIIIKKDYREMMKNMKKAQEKFRLSKSIKKLENFYDEVAKRKVGEKVENCDI